MDTLTEVMQRNLAVGPEAPASTGARLQRYRSTHTLLAILTVVAFGLPVAGYFWIIHHYGVNVLVADQLTNVTVVKDAYSSHFRWGPLWAQHNNDRQFFPNLIVIGLAWTVRLNVVIEEYLSAVMLVATTGLLILTHRRRSPSTPWLYYLPVVLLMFSLSQYFNTLWGYQLCWYLILLCLAVALALLDRPTLHWIALAGAVAAGIVGSYSSFEGLLIWPTGLVLLYHRRRSVRFLGAWIGAAVLTVLQYFHDFRIHVAAPRPHYAIRHPLVSLNFYLALVGYVARFVARVGTKVGHAGTVEALFGLVIIGLALATIAAYGLRRDEHGGGPLGVSLICFGLLFAGAVTQGRVTKGYIVASASRYTSFDLLILVGIYLALLDRPAIAGVMQRGKDNWKEGAEATSKAVANKCVLTERNIRVVHSVMVGAMLMVIATQVATSTNTGLIQIQGTHRHQRRAVYALQNLDVTSNKALPGLDLSPHRSDQYIRHQLQLAQELHLSLYEGKGWSL